MGRNNMEHMGLCAWTILMSCFATLTSGYLWDVPSIPENRTEVMDDWIKMDHELKLTAESWLLQLMPLIMKSSTQLDLSSQCMGESMQFISGLFDLKKWAFSFLDSSVRVPLGTLSGNLVFFGEYEQCVDTVVPSEPDGGILFRGQYCTTKVRPALPHKSRRYRLEDGIKELNTFNGSEVIQFLVTKAHLFYFLPYRAGFCIPSGCTANDLAQVLNLVAEKYHVSTEVTHCEVKKNAVQLSTIQIIAIICCSIVVAIVLIGTCLEKYSNNHNIQFENLACNIFLSFSLITSFKRLTSTKASAGTFGCIYGIRFLSICWILLNHSYIISAWFLRSYRNMHLAQYVMQEPLVQIAINGSEAVDSFFFMGGMLLSYLTMRFVKVEGIKFSLKGFLFHRFWRLGPPYYFLLLLGMLVPLMGSGPLFHETMQETVYPCYQHWWKNLLFINNFFPLKDMCWMHTWYMSCDFQLYISSLLVIFPLLRSEKIGVAINIFIIIASVVYTGVVVYLYDLAPTLMMTYPDPEDRALGALYSYGNPFSRAGPYFIGFFIGYILATKPKLKFSKKVQVLGWCMALVSVSLVVFIYGLWFHFRSPTGLEILIYAAFYKVAFTGGIAWMTLCCITGQGGFINTFLCWKPWIPLSKLSFLIYIIQPMIQVVYIANFQSPQEYNHIHLIMQFFGFLGTSGVLAFIFNMLLESPLLLLEKKARNSVLKKNIKVSKSNLPNDNPEIKNGNSHQNMRDVVSKNYSNKAYESQL